LVSRVWPKLESREIRPTIYRVLPIEKAQEAHALLEQSLNVGKVVLAVRG
ncbi:MAG: zinc-binding dehydrogenase, partial [Clostridiaceae bacterium]|nr:zinc-binding dehydrogenase [Clostridiaceae bacterium]